MDDSHYRQDTARFHHVTQNGIQFKTLFLGFSMSFRLWLTAINKVWKVKAQIREGYCAEDLLSS
jgi:hypothetical protein